MQDLIAHLDAKEHEIGDFMAQASSEREKLRSCLNEVDKALADSDENLRRINKARNALRNPTDQQTMADDMESVRAGSIPTEAAKPLLSKWSDSL